MVRQFLDVVHQAVELPLRIDLLPAAQREAVEALVVAEVGKHRLHRGEAPPVEGATLRAVDGPAHDLGVAWRRATRLAAEETDLPGLRLLRRAQAALALGAGHAIALRPWNFTATKPLWMQFAPFR